MGRGAEAEGADITNPCAGVVESLGSATVLCFPDVDGVLAEPILCAKQVLPSSFFLFFFLFLSFAFCILFSLFSLSLF